MRITKTHVDSKTTHNHYDTLKNYTGTTFSYNSADYSTTSRGSVGSAVLHVLLPIFILCIILSYSNYTVYSIFNVESFTGALSSVTFQDEESSLSTFLTNTNNKIDSWYNENSDNFAVQGIYSVIKSIRNVLNSLYNLVYGIEGTLTILKDTVKNFLSGNYWINKDDAIPPDIQQYLYNFS